MKIKTFLAAHSIIFILFTICFAGIFYLLIGHLIFPLIFNEHTPNAIKFIENRGLDILFAAISILISHEIYKNKIGFRKRNFLRGIFSIGIILTVLYTIKMISWFYLFKVSNSLSTIIINFLLCTAAAFCTALYEESFCRGLLFNLILKANKKKAIME